MKVGRRTWILNHFRLGDLGYNSGRLVVLIHRIYSKNCGCRRSGCKRGGIDNSISLIKKVTHTARDV